MAIAVTGDVGSIQARWTPVGGGGIDRGFQPGKEDRSFHGPMRSLISCLHWGNPGVRTRKG